MKKSISGKRLAIAREVRKLTWQELADAFTKKASREESRDVRFEVSAIQKWQNRGIPPKWLFFVSNFFMVDESVFIDKKLSDQDFKKIIFASISIDKFKHEKEGTSSLLNIDASLSVVDTPLSEVDEPLPKESSNKQTGQQPRRKAILFVDFVNFYNTLKQHYHYKEFKSTHMLKIMEYLENTYNCNFLYSSIYADWGQYPSEFQGNCVQAQCNPIHISSGKFSVGLPITDDGDNRIIIDCMEWLSLHRNSFEILILISSDIVFMPLVYQFMRHGKDVIIGSIKNSTNVMLIKKAAGAFFINEILCDELEACKEKSLGD